MQQEIKIDSKTASIGSQEVGTESHPLVSLVILSFNHESYIREAVESALAQTYSPLEIIISDDGSKDNTSRVIADTLQEYKGPHRILVNSNPSNLGIAGNVNKCWELTSGEFVVFQGGDDISLPHRVQRMVQEWHAHSPRPDLVYSGQTLIDEVGKVIGERPGVMMANPSIAETVLGKRVFVAGGCAAGYTRRVHYGIGPLRSDVIAEDFVYSFRALLLNGAKVIKEPLVLYRQHSKSILGELRVASERGLSFEKFIRGHLALLLEYKRALSIHESSASRYLNWRLQRRINSNQRELQANAGDARVRLNTALWALSTCRWRMFQKLAGSIFSKQGN
jgi:glycosyltransferase involved in cell wall biosynthesis